MPLFPMSANTQMPVGVEKQQARPGGVSMVQGVQHEDVQPADICQAHRLNPRVSNDATVQHDR